LDFQRKISWAIEVANFNRMFAGGQEERSAPLFLAMKPVVVYDRNSTKGEKTSFFVHERIASESDQVSGAQFFPLLTQTEQRRGPGTLQPPFPVMWVGPETYPTDGRPIEGNQFSPGPLLTLTNSGQLLDESGFLRIRAIIPPLNPPRSRRGIFRSKIEP